MTESTLHQQIDDLRRQIASTAEELEWTADAPLPKAEAKARIAEFTKSLASRAGCADLVGSLTLETARPDDLGRLISVAARSGGMGAADVNLGGLLCWLFPDQIAKHLTAEIDALDYTAGPPAAERPKQLAVLRKRLRELEQTEEALICRAEELNVFIARRRDADPAVVLGYDRASPIEPAPQLPLEPATA